jgi:xanthine dehydrogenase accessory factor
MRLDTLAALNEERRLRRPCLTITHMASGEVTLVRAAELSQAPWTHDPLAPVLAQALREGRSRMVGEGSEQRFLTVMVPPVRVVVIGAVHISQALVPIAGALGLDMVVVDPRTAFASPERFPGVLLHAEWPQDVLPGLAVDAFTAMVALTHDPKIDDPALTHGLAAGCFYVGALGSRKTHEARLERLGRAGVPAEQLARIRAPIGLDIGAVSPAEIALAIAGEIVATLRLPGAGKTAVAA